MTEPRKIYRIERTAPARPTDSIEAGPNTTQHAEIMSELRALSAALSALVPIRPRAVAGPHHGDGGRLTSELNFIAGAFRGDGHADQSGGKSAPAAASSSRVEAELKAVVDATEQATQKILAAAEEIDSAANALSAALAGRIEQGLAQDIGDLVIEIFEACNFQDLIGQRVGKVLAALQFVEEHIARVLAEIKTASSGQGLHGPRLADDDGHASQDDIDAMFDVQLASSEK
jgi:chemotaxis protein CheZ